MKIPSDQGPIAIHGSQEAARRAEGNWTDSKAIHNIDGAEACCSVPKIQILNFSQTRSKLKMNFKFCFKMFVCKLISTNKL
jgi:hypothetical protein